jgi:hypothetical protein
MKLAVFDASRGLLALLDPRPPGPRSCSKTPAPMLQNIPDRSRHQGRRERGTNPHRGLAPDTSKCWRQRLVSRGETRTRYQPMCEQGRVQSQIEGLREEPADQAIERDHRSARPQWSPNLGGTRPRAWSTRLGETGGARADQTARQPRGTRRRAVSARQAPAEASIVATPTGAVAPGLRGPIGG